MTNFDTSEHETEAKPAEDQQVVPSPVPDQQGGEPFEDTQAERNVADQPHEDEPQSQADGERQPDDSHKSRPEHEQPRSNPRRHAVIAPRPRDEWGTRRAYALTAASSVKVPNTFSEALTTNESAQWLEACQAELRSIEDNETWEECELPPGRSVIQPKWVFDLKQTEGGEVDLFKARLVAKGFRQVAGVDYFDTSPPLAKHTSIGVD